MEGDHDSPRPQWALDHAYVFLQHKLIAGGSIPSSSSLSSPLSSLSSSVEGKEEKEEEVEVVVGGGGEEGAARVIPALSLPDMWKQRGKKRGLVYGLFFLKRDIRTHIHFFFFFF